MVPGMTETLRVNGTATIARDAPLFDRMAVGGKRPKLAVAVEVTELFLHRAKAFLRAGLWQPDTWPTRDSLPSAGRIAKDHMGTKIPAAVLDAAFTAEGKLNRY